MTTLSLLRNCEEFKELKISLLLPKKVLNKHPDSEWFRKEYTDWSKQYKDFNGNTTELILATKVIEFLYSSVKSKQRVLNICKAFEISGYIDFYIEESRKQKSETIIKNVINDLINAFKTGKCDPQFVAGIN